MFPIFVANERQGLWDALQWNSTLVYQYNEQQTVAKAARLVRERFDL
jgi:hypothetical protein